MLLSAGKGIDEMLKLSKQELAQLETRYSGITETIQRFEEAKFPACPRCQSENTAQVNCGVIGRTINIAAATTIFTLIPNAPKPDEYFCNDCKEFFN
jgi:hypothetical protein